MASKATALALLAMKKRAPFTRDWFKPAPEQHQCGELRKQDETKE
ncbi:MAG: hypothetical protein SFZ23_07015 [Planctomycetota bacterium]|nr:hypothetical protein [Planctomycetota bacterium]